MPIEFDKVRDYVEQTIFLLGQATNTMTHHRIYIISSGLNCAPQQSKEMSRKDVNLLQQDDEKIF